MRDPVPNIDLRLFAKIQPNPFNCFGGNASRMDRQTDRQTDSKLNNRLLYHEEMATADIPRLGKKNAREQRGRGWKGRRSRPEGSRAGDKVLGEGTAGLHLHQLAGPGSAVSSLTGV